MPQNSTAKLTKWFVCTVKTQISLRVHSLLRIIAERIEKMWAFDTHKALIKDYVDEHADFNLCISQTFL